MSTSARKKRSRRKMTEQEKRQAQLQRTIQRMFKRAGFTYFSTKNLHGKFGGKDIEIDSVYVLENVILFCEDTISKDSKHRLKAEETARIISNNFEAVLEWLKEKFADKSSLLDAYPPRRFQRRFLYIPESEIDFDPERFEHLTLCNPKTLRYFDLITSAIKRSSIYEILRFLNIDDSEFGLADSGFPFSSITANIVCPEERIGLDNNIRAVSFMLSPEHLLKYGYVLRKDNWETPDSVYQRLIEPNRISSIRQYIANNRQAFLNNVIVSLPSDVVFRDAETKAQVDLKEIAGYPTHYSVDIPRRFNTIRIIDGQHRIYAYHKADDSLEEAIAPLRDKLHLLVTGLVFPPEISDTKRAQYESQIFLDINEHAKKVSSDVILYIQELKDAFCPEGIARRVLSELNTKRLFTKKFQLSSLDDAGIKTTSIIKFALRGIVTFDVGDPGSLITYWNGEKTPLLEGDRSSLEAEASLAGYTSFICEALMKLFGGVKHAFEKEWDDPESKIQSVTAINGFILAFKKILPTYGVKEESFYSERFSNLGISFYRSATSDEGFPFASSQYAMMAERIIYDCFPELSADSQE